MLRLPAALIEDISLRAGQLAALSQTCTALWHVLNQPEIQLRYYLALQRRRCLADSSSYHTAAVNSSSRGAANTTSGLGPGVVYELLECRARPTDTQGTLRLLQLMLACGSMVQAFPAAHQAAVPHVLAGSDSRVVPQAAQVIIGALPYAEHCMLHFCAGSGHLQLLKVLLPRSSAPVRLHGVLHYVKSSAFLAAAAGGHVPVLTELLAAGAARWACQLPGASLTSSALDQAALGGHMEAMQLLSLYVANPSPYFLTAAADSGSGAAMELALQQWFGQFSAVTAFSRAHVLQMHDALKVSCQRGHVSAVRQLLGALHRINNDDCCVLALTYASSTSNTEAIQAVLESSQLPIQLSRGGPKLISKLAQAVASCVRIAILKHCRPALDLLLTSLTTSNSPLSAVRPLLAPQMRFIFDTAAQSGNGTALQLLLLLLPEHYEALGASALEAALSEGHADLAATIKMLLMMQGPDPGLAAAALSPEGNPGLAKASLNGAFRSACVRGDTAALQSLLQLGPEGPDDNVQLLMLRLAAGGGKEEAVRLLLDAFGGAGGVRQEANLRAVCRGAVHAGQMQLLQSLAADRPSSALLSHITSQPEALAEYLRAALLCAQVDVAAWLVMLAAEQQQMDLVISTLSSLLTTSRWELLNAGRGVATHQVVFDLLKRLAAHALANNTNTSNSGGSTTAPQAGNTTAQQHAGPGAAGAGVGLSPAAAAGASNIDGAGAAAAVGQVPSGGQGPSNHGCCLGRELLQPQLLSQLLHVSQGQPWRLFTLVQVVDWWGLYTPAAPAALLQQQQTQQQPVQPATQHQTNRVEVAASTDEAPQQQQDQLRQQQQHQEQSSCDGASSSGAATQPLPRSSSGASISSDGSAHDSSSVTSSSSGGGSGSGDAACDVVSPCVTCPPDDSPPSVVAERPRLLPATSMEVGSLTSEDCQHTHNWLDELIQRGNAAASSTGKPTEAQQQQSGCRQKQQQQRRRPGQGVTTCDLPPLAKEWGGSWQQLTGQVAQLHMDNGDVVHQQHQPGQAVRAPRQSFDYEQHLAQQLRRRHQYSGRRESLPGRASSAAAAARQLRATLSQPFGQAPHCPVHPYMQQSSGQQQQSTQQ